MSYQNRDIVFTKKLLC